MAIAAGLTFIWSDMATIEYLFQYILHIDDYLFSFVATYGIWTYAALFLIIFCETGLVVTPFLPGDSLLFAAGSIAANHLSNEAEHILSIQLLFIVLTIAAILGNKVNYFIGRGIGPKIFTSDTAWWLNKKHLNQAHQFYETYGGKTIILSRFLPIIRTFVPFVAGISTMSIKKFTFYNVISALLWVSSLLFAGYFFGKLPFIKQNFSFVIYVIIILSLLPPLIIFLKKKLSKKFID